MVRGAHATFGVVAKAGCRVRPAHQSAVETNTSETNLFPAISKIQLQTIIIRITMSTNKLLLLTAIMIDVKGAKDVT